ncbi:EAL domain-containing protein, partial [Escherichia marmotae]|uniref:EAL domain-containing protein n=1 Tax=Escherichia marmotae TaxID=1499973 RepID=UPI00355BE0D2
NRLIRCVCGKKIGPDPRNFNQRVSLGRNDLLIRTFPKYQIEAWQLIFEVTESNILTNVKQAQNTLQHLQELGCQIAIDDFGTGYASYARLKNVNANLLKIDGSFIRNIVSNSLDYQIVASICHLARMKKMQVVAEYVENEEIRQAVHSLGIDYLQGFLIGEPQLLVDMLDEREPVRESA